MLPTDRETLMQDGVVTRNLEGRTAIRAVHCRVFCGPAEGKQVTVGSRTLVVGAGLECDLVLEDPSVSRRHAELQVVPEGIRVKDLGSTNGTFFNRSRVSEVIVPVGSTVSLADTGLRLSGAPAMTLPASERTQFGRLIGRSVVMREVFAILEMVSPSDATVLIEGESGTGKELAARAIHDASPRAAHTFVVIDCGAINEQLVDSHLFGHTKGAFTGAADSRGGAFLKASKGTLFLDEIGELPAHTQVKLLRAIEDQTIQPVGSDERLTVDSRIVAATHRNLHERVQSGAFRHDLFHRLGVIHLLLPALRDRPEDIPALVEKFCRDRGSDVGDIAGANLELLQRYSWPGNVRELRNVLERALVLSGADCRFSDLKLWLETGQSSKHQAIDATLPFKEAKEKVVSAFEAQYLNEVLDAQNWNISRAAEHAGLSRKHFRDLMQKHGLDS